MGVDDGLNVAAELAALRGEMNTGFTKVEGQLALLVQSTQDNKSDLDKLDQRVTALEARRLPVGLVAGISGAVSAVGAAAALFIR